MGKVNLEVKVKVRRFNPRASIAIVAIYAIIAMKKFTSNEVLLGAVQGKYAENDRKETRRKSVKDLREAAD